MVSVNVSKSKEQKQLVKYIIHLKNIENKYWCDLSLIETKEKLNEMALGKKINANSYIDIYDVSFGEENKFLFILSNRNLNIYFTKIKEDIYCVEIEIFTFLNCLGYMDIGINKLNIKFELNLQNM